MNKKKKKKKKEIKKIKVMKIMKKIIFKDLILIIIITPEEI